MTCPETEIKMPAKNISADSVAQYDTLLRRNKKTAARECRFIADAYDRRVTFIINAVLLDIGEIAVPVNFAHGFGILRRDNDIFLIEEDRV